MIAQSKTDIEGISNASSIAAQILKALCAHAKAGMSTLEIDQLGGELLKQYKASSAPKKAYQFPGNTCISVNDIAAHGIPSKDILLKNGDLINIDVSVEHDGYWSDNGCSFIIGEDIHHHSLLIETSKNILREAIDLISDGVRIAQVGKHIQTQAHLKGFKVIKNLTGHGVGRSLHEEPKEIANYPTLFDLRQFKKGQVVAIETFISTHSSYVNNDSDGWSLKGDKGGFVAQHEHTILVTDNEPIILTLENGIWS
ncbi:MAG: type I methionyl aminopeptidase [Sphingobacteriaceae bacterium]|jgi:methionyl aminopeptidase